MIYWDISALTCSDFDDPCVKENVSITLFTLNDEGKCVTCVCLLELQVINQNGPEWQRRSAGAPQSNICASGAIPGWHLLAVPSVATRRRPPLTFRFRQASDRLDWWVAERARGSVGLLSSLVRYGSFDHAGGAEFRTCAEGSVSG